MRKKIILSSAFVISTLPTFFIVSCSQNNTNNTLLEQTKNNLNKFISENNDLFNSNNVNPIYQNNNKVNMFNVLVDNELISFHFNIQKSQIKVDDNVSVFLDFVFGIEDSFGNKAYPLLSADNTTITIPVLVYYNDTKNNIQITKYQNMFSLNIVNDKVNDEEQTDYNGVNGKKVVFKNSSTQVDFQIVPSTMIDRYLEFVNVINTVDYQIGPVYPSDSETLKKWKGKTLSEVKSMSNAIVAPKDIIVNKVAYSYSIVNSFFNPKNRQYADYIMRISLKSTIDSNIINDAKEIYGLVFQKDYSITKTDWEFKEPSDSDISSYVSYNKELLNPIVANIKQNVQLYTPTILMNPNDAKEQGTEKIVESYKKGARLMEAPSSFTYNFTNGQSRKISFSIDTVDVDSSDTNNLKISLFITIDEGDLAHSETYEKVFNIQKWEFV